MIRGGTRWSIAIGALLGLSLLLPAATLASTPLSLNLVVTPTTAFTDQDVTFTATASPAVASLPITFTVINSGYSNLGYTDSDGVASVTIHGDSEYLLFTWSVVATFPGDGTYAAATSNSVPVTFIQHPASVTISVGNPWPDDGPVNTIDFPTVHARLTADVCEGEIDVTESQGGSQVGPGWSGQARLVANEDGSLSCGADVRLPQQPVGTYDLQVSSGGTLHNESAVSPVIQLPITLVQTNTALTVSSNPVEAGTTISLTATVSTPKGYGFISGGTVTFMDGATTLGSAPLSSDGSLRASLNASFVTVGTHDVTATWSGSATASPSTSPPVPVVVSTDVVDASGLGVTATTFYPEVDGYGDTVGIRGTLGEMASVAVTITQVSTGKVVRRFDVPTQSAGPYLVSWDGRTTSWPGYRHLPGSGGTIVPAGTYRVTQVVTDGLGMHLTVTSTVTVSLKRLYWYSGSQTLYANQYKAKGTSGSTITTSSTYYRGMRLNVGLGPGLYAALGYQFTLPSAASYASISFYLLGSGNLSPMIGLQNRQLGTWPAGAAWDIGDFSLASVSSRYVWSHVTGDGVYNRIGQTVRGMVLGIDAPFDHYDISQVKLTYRYALLK